MKRTTSPSSGVALAGAVPGEANALSSGISGTWFKIEAYVVPSTFTDSAPIKKESAYRKIKNILRAVEFENTANLLIVAVTIGVGMLPVVAPKIYHTFPAWAHVIGGSAITSAALTAFVLNLLFHHTKRAVALR